MNYALRKTVEDNVEEFDPETIETIRRHCLRSVKSEPAAVGLSDQLRKCLAKGGFRLTKWISNSPALIESIPESERAPSVKQLDFNKSKHIERPLGVQWNVATDKFGFSITVKDRPLTRRDVLSTFSSPSKWRYVDTKSNPADDASRGQTVESLIQEQRWIKGPQFLWLLSDQLRKCLAKGGFRRSPPPLEGIFCSLLFSLSSEKTDQSESTNCAYIYRS